MSVRTLPDVRLGGQVQVACITIKLVIVGIIERATGDPS